MPEYQGKSVKLNSPSRISKGEPGYGRKKFKVFVKDGDKIKTVRFGDANMSIKRDDPKRRKAFFDRMKPILANVKGNKKLSPVYWSLRSWKLGTKIS